MYSRVVVGLDGSPASETALPVACDAMGCTGGMLYLVHAIDALDLERMGAWTRYAFGRHVQAVASETETGASAARAYLSELAAALPGQQVTPVVRIGEAAHVIATVAAEVDADLIVLASHGRTGLTRVAVGSVAASVVGMATVPVLVIGPCVAGAVVHADGPTGRSRARGAGVR